MTAIDLRFVCSHCGQALICGLKLAGRQMQCPTCNHLISIPKPAEPGITHLPTDSGATWDTFIPKA